MLSKEELRKKAQGTEQNQNTSSKKTNSSKILSQEELVKKANVKYKITQKDVDFVNSLYKSVNNYVDSYNTDIKNLNFNTASELRDKYAQQGEALRKQAEAVKNTVKYLDLQPLEQEQITKDIDEMLLNIGKGSNLLGEAVDMYSQFGNEEEYNQAINFIDFMSDDKKAENEKKKKQQEAMADIIDRYERSKYENYSINPLKETPVAGPQGVIKELAKNGIVFDDLQIVNGDISKFEADLKRKYEEISGEIASYEGMVRAFEFEKTVQDYKTKFAEDGTIKKWQETGSKDYASFVAYNGEMTEDEKEIYNVLAERAGQKIQSYSTESSAHNTYVVVDGKYLKSYEEQIEYKYADKDVAKDLKISVDEWKKIKGYVKEFLDYSEYLKDAIAQRKGVKIAEGLKGKTILEELYSLWGGINNFGQGVSTAITKDTRPSATTYASAMVRDDLVKNNGKWGSLYGLLYDTGTSVGQMLPSIALAYATGGASSAFGAGAETAKLVSGLTFKTSFGASAYGNAYSEMINAGYREGQAKAYATMSAASEVLLQDLLGGIGKFSGKLTNSAMQKVIENIDNAFLKVVASGAVSSMGEFTEESLQEIVSPIFKTLVTGKVDPIKWGDVIYAGVMGALTSVAMNAPAGIAGGAQNIVQKISNSGFALTQKGVKNLSVTRDIYDFASTMPEYTTAYKLSQVASKGGNAYNMVSELAHQKKPLTEAQSEALKNRLTEDGYTPEIANKIVDSAVKVSNNISVLTEQKNAIQENALLTSAILEVVTEADAKTLGISEQFNKRNEETVFAREEVHKKATENIVKTAEEGGKTITTEEATTKGRSALKAPKNATVRKISDVVLSKANNPELTDEQIKKNEKVIMDIGKALGRKIIIEDESSATNDKEQKISVNGYFDKKTGEIHLSRNAKRPIEWILKHEITHSGERTKAYDNFVKKLVKNEVYAEWLRGRTGVDASVDVMEAMLGDEVRQIYAKKGIELGKEQGAVTEARQEIIADFIGDMLFNSDTSNLETFLNQLDKPARNKFIQWVLDVIDKIKNAFAKGDKKLLNEINTLERQFSDMLKDAGKETEKKGMKNDNTKKEKLSLEEENIIDLSKDNELSKRIGTLTGSKKYKVIKSYIQEVLGNQPIIMNDGKKVIVDNTDANHISNKAWDKKTAEISEIKKLIESAKLWAEDKSPTHPKFNYFCYYKADVRYENEVFPIYLNVGRTINDKTYHLYDITNEIRDTADRINGLERPKPNEGYALRNGISKNKIPQAEQNVNTKNSISPETDKKYLSAVAKGDMETAQRMVDKAAKEAGYTENLYHQTENDFFKFDTRHKGAGTRDNETPFGIFMKKSDTDIGIKGKKQMRLFAKIQNPLKANNRESLVYELKRISPEYKNIKEKLNNLDKEYQEKFDNAKNAWRKWLEEWRKKNPNAERREAYNDPEFEEIFSREKKITEEWTDKATELDRQAKEIITTVLKENNYDGIILLEDKGSFGRSTEAYIALDSTQVKSADPVTYDDDGNVIPLSERFNTANEDIRYSLSETDVAKFKPIARQLMRDNQIDGDVEDFAKVLKNSFVDVSKDDVGSYEGVMPAVKWLQNNAKTTVHLDDYSRDVLSTLRRLNVYLDDVQREEVISAFDSYGDFRKKLMGSITISKKENARESLDTAWQELADTYPEIFDADTNSADMPAALLMAVNDLRSGKFNAEDGSVETDEADLISQVYESYLENIEKFEDKKPVSDYAEQVDELNEKLENEEITKDEYKAEINRLFKEAGEKYGTIRQGESVTGNENFEDAVPQSVAKGTKMRQYARTVTEATKDPTLDNILTTEQKKQILSDARMHYAPTSNKENIQKALSKVARGEGRETWLSTVKGEKPATSVDIAFGELLLESAIENGDAGHVLQYTAELAELGTRLGQAVQAFSLLKRMGGLGQLYYVQQAVNTLNKDLEERFGKQIAKGKIKKVKINEALAMQLAESKTEEDFAISYEAIMRDIASQVPSTFLDKWNAWRYMAMLANPVTMLRNLFGNAFFAPVVQTKNFLATSFESISKPEERSKTFKVPKEYKEFAKNDWAEVEKIITHGGKYNYATEIDEYRTIFKTKVLEGIRKGYTGVLEGTDALFLKGYYRQALSGYLAANKADLNNLSKETLAKAREYAIKEARKATYRDASKLSSILNQISKNKLYGPIVEGILPFKKTPINILKRGVEYSPIGLVKTLSKGLFGLVTDNKMSATDFCDGLASGTTGTGLFAIGMFLMASGLVTIGIDDEDEWWRKLNGEQDFAITLWGKSYTIDWMAPACMPLFMGAAVYDAITQETNENPFNAVLNAGMGALDVIVDMSMLQGISNLLDSIKFTKSADGGVFQLATNAIMSYANQGLPTVVGKITNTIDDTRRTTYIDKTKGMEGVQSAYDNILKKFAPWERQAYVNAWGEEEKTGPVWQRILQNFVSPGYYSEIEANKVTEKISELYKETKDKKILPEIPAKKVSFKGITKNLTGEEYYIYATTRGQKNADYLAEMVENEKFLQLTTEQQAKVIKNLYEFSDAYSKSLLDYTYDDIVAMDVVNVTEEEYNKLSKETKTALAKAFFLKSYGNETKLERNGGSVVDYYIDQEIKASQTPQKEKKKQSVSEAIKNFS